MKKEVILKETQDKLILSLDSEESFCIDKKEALFDSKKFYDAFYAQYKIFPEYIVVNSCTSPESKIVFDIVDRIFQNINKNC